MSLGSFLLLVVAGGGAGLVGYLTGLASLVSYPALLLAGLSPVSANITNTLGLVGAGAGSLVKGARPFLAPDWRNNRRDLIIQMAAAAAGGLIGGVILVVAAESSFTTIVPWLVALAAVLLLFSPQIKTLSRERVVPKAVYYFLLLCVCVYGGYFGAGAGVIYLAVTALASKMPFEKAVFVKSVLLSISNLAASVFFAFSGEVNWLAALALLVGCTGGGYLGPIVQRWIPEPVLRWVIALAGLGLAVWLFLR